MSELDELLTKLGKAFGKHSICLGSDIPPPRQIETGSFGFDYVTGGGVPINRITELVGKEHSTKTLHALLAAAAFQKHNWGTVKNPIAKKVAWIDTEHTFTKEWATKHGVDNKNLIYSQPASLEDAGDIMNALLAQEDVSLVVFDSMAAVGAKDEIDKSLSDEAKMANNARFWNRAIRCAQSSLNKNNKRDTTLIVVNGMYEKVGLVFGDPSVTKNGNQLKYAKSMSVKFYAQKPKVSKIDGEEAIFGTQVSFECLKNKMSKPFKKAEAFYSLNDSSGIPYGTFDNESSMLELLCRNGIISKKASWYLYQEIKEQGGEKFMLAAKKYIQEFKTQLYGV